MAFWIRTGHILTEFWEETILKNFGNFFGTLRKVVAVNRRIKASVKADGPLAFHSKAQMPTGAIVKVSLSYEKLYRWCKHCRRICHIAVECPLLLEAQRRKYVEDSFAQNLHGSIDADVSLSHLSCETRPLNRSQTHRRDSLSESQGARSGYAPKDPSRGKDLASS